MVYHENWTRLEQINPWLEMTILDPTDPWKGERKVGRADEKTFLQFVHDCTAEELAARLQRYSDSTPQRGSRSRAEQRRHLVELAAMQDRLDLWRQRRQAAED